MLNQVALQRSLSDVVAEYDLKLANVPAAMAAFNKAAGDLTIAATVGGTYGNINIDTGHTYDRVIAESLLKSAWLNVYAGLNIERISSAADKAKFKQAMEKPAPFTLDNIRGTFGDYIKNPRGNILRALAEAFCNLDPAYKSHDKVKIGVAGLPKRVIIRNVNSHGWGRDYITNILNALAAYQSKPLVEHYEIAALLENPDALLVDGTLPPSRYETKTQTLVGRGVRLKRFENGNGHLIFEPATLRDINRALAEYYGDVLADTSEAKPDKPKTGTDVAKDLQYYPTPVAVVDRVLCDVYVRKGDKVLEPSCGDGRILDALRKTGAETFGIEIDSGRVNQSRAKGHAVMQANFLETAPNPIYDRVVMNPPFYGKHYAKHVEHAFKFLKPGGTLTAILPVTARYDHGLLSGSWSDLPVGSFSESGTNINTTVLTMRK